MAPPITEVSVTISIEASALFEDDNVNWRYCTQQAPFPHRDACEFFLYCYEPDYVSNRIADMRKFGCTPEFIEAYQQAHALGAMHVLFYA